MQKLIISFFLLLKKYFTVFFLLLLLSSSFFFKSSNFKFFNLFYYSLIKLNSPYSLTSALKYKYILKKYFIHDHSFQ